MRLLTTPATCLPCLQILNNPRQAHPMTNSSPRSYKYLSLSSLPFDSLHGSSTLDCLLLQETTSIELIFIFTTSVYPMVSRKWVLANEGPIKICQRPCCCRTGPWWQPHLTALWLHLLRATLPVMTSPVSLWMWAPNILLSPLALVLFCLSYE